MRVNHAHWILQQRVREKGVRGQELPPYSPLTVVVPGAAALWEDVVKEHGRKTLQEVPAFILSIRPWLSASACWHKLIAKTALQ